MNIYQKLVAIRSTVTYLQKENTGTQYKYVSSSQVLSTVRAAMDEMGLVLVPSVKSHNVIESPIETKDSSGNITKRTITYFTEIDLSYTWINAENPEEKIVCDWYGQGVDIAGEKGVGKALTYAEKYFLLKFFNIATDKDDPDSFQDKHEPQLPKDQNKNNGKQSTPAEPKQKTWDEMNNSERIQMMIIQMHGKENYKPKLKEYTAFKGKDGNDVPGVESLNDLKDARINATYGKIKDIYEKWKTPQAS